MSLERFIKFITEGEPVASGTPNRPLRQLDQNIQYLWDIIEAANLGSTVYAREVTVESSAELGMPVYWNPSTSSFDRAIAKMDTDSTTGYIKTSDSSQVWGIVAIKHEATLADILLFGYAPIEISAATGSTGGVPAGTYYLSGTGLGKLVLQKPPVSVPVLRADGSGNVYVNPSFMDFLENHQHYKFDLTMLPAGDTTAPTEGNIHTITSPDTTLTGWLPADDAIFEGNAPANAKFGYNIDAESGLKNLFPPIPLESVDVELLRPSVYDSPGLKLRERLAGQALSDLVQVDRNGIWWMSDCYDQVPWPTDYTTGDSISYSPYDCPADVVPAMLLYFTKVNFATDQTVVRSLTSTDTRIKIYCTGSTTVDSTGDLDIDLDLQFVTNEDQAGYKVLKALDGETFTRGPIAEGIYAPGTNVTLYAIDDSGTTVPPETVDGKQVYRGNVGITVSTALSLELAPHLVRLEGVTEEHIPVLYLGMTNDYATSYTVKFDIPADAGENSNFKFRVRMLGRLGGSQTLPQLTFSYTKSTRPDSGTPIINPVPDGAAASITDLVTNAATIVTADSAVEATQTTGITVDPGDIIYIKVSRDPADAGDTYGGEVGIMQQTGVLS
jgi:hypothetical protein